MPLEILEVHFDCAGSQNLVGWRWCLSRLRSRCGFDGPKSTFCESGFTSKCRFRGKRSTLNGDLLRALIS